MSGPARRDATASGLRYASTDSPGIGRRGRPGSFRYVDPDGRPVRDAAVVERIRRIAIPPAWTDVWICPDPDGHLQAIGRDARGRRQYRYHPRFRSRRDDAKFARLLRFGMALPRIRRTVRIDLARRGLPREKVLAAVVHLLETTSFRVGNAQYARLNRSFGLSTLRRRHVTVSGGSIRFRFRGKGGRIEERMLVDRRLAAVVRRCQDLPGQALFKYPDDDGEERAVTSEDVNGYLRDAAGSEEFSAKDFRTWTATVVAHRALRRASGALGGGTVDAVRLAIRHTATEINDTVAVTRNSYIHPAVLEAFAAEPASTRPRGNGGVASDDDLGGLADEPISRREELAVLAILRGRSATRDAATARARRR